MQDVRCSVQVQPDELVIHPELFSPIKTTGLFSGKLITNCSEIERKPSMVICFNLGIVPL